MVKSQTFSTSFEQQRTEMFMQDSTEGLKAELSDICFQSSSCWQEL